MIRTVVALAMCVALARAAATTAPRRSREGDSDEGTVDGNCWDETGRRSG